MRYPSNVKRTSSPFGMRGKKFHDGADFPIPLRTELFSVSDGGKLIRKAFDSDGYGNYIVLEYPTFQAVYAHLNEFPNYSIGHVFKEGESLGKISGNTGFSTGPHLHFEIRVGDVKDLFVSDKEIPTKFKTSVDPIIFLEDNAIPTATEILNMLDSPERWKPSIDLLTKQANEYDMGLHSIWKYAEYLIRDIYELGRKSVK